MPKKSTKKISKEFAFIYKLLALISLLGNVVVSVVNAPFDALSEKWSEKKKELNRQKDSVNYYLSKVKIKKPSFSQTFSHNLDISKKSKKASKSATMSAKSALASFLAFLSLQKTKAIDYFSNQKAEFEKRAQKSAQAREQQNKEKKVKTALAAKKSSKTITKQTKEDIKKTKKTPKPKSKTTKQKKSRKRYIGVSGAFVLGIFFGLVFIMIPIQLSGWFRELPRPELLAQTNNQTTKILDREGRLLFEIYTDRQYEYVSLDKIPQELVNATIAVEDDAFYNHVGIRPASMLRAAKATVLDDELQGASTITQQLIKNALLTPERTVSRKTKEVVLALMVERKYSKEEILELYLNNVAYGGTAWGVQSASQKFFGKDVNSLSLAESSMIAGLPLSPTTYSPLNDFEKAKARQRFVLSKMVEQGYITDHDANIAYAQELELAPQIGYIRAPHFVNYVKDELTKIYGPRMVEFGGLTVRTTLDLDLQDQIQQIVTSQVEASQGLNISNGAAVVLDSKTGEVLAYVGSKDFFANDYDGAYDVARAFRQPGSSIKILTYALALEEGMTPVTTIVDAPFSVTSYGQTYTPKNYDGKYHGNVTLRSAFANSYNIPAVKLARRLGPDNIVEFGKDLGLEGWEVDGQYGLSITLGGREVRLLDLASVYATFARNGQYIDETPIISVKDANGFEIYDISREPEQIVSEGVAYLVSNILSDNRARTPAFGPSSELVVPGHNSVAVKTGTTDLNKDNWTVGYTPTYTVAVWVGNNDNEPMNQRLVSGLSGAAPIWNNIMTTVLQDVPDEPFSKPASVIVKYDRRCNTSEVFVEGTAPSKLCPEKQDKDKDKKED